MRLGDRDKPTALIHLYRAEVGRMTAYHVRLDTTTHWALGATVVTVTFVLGDPSVPHYVMLVSATLVAMFWWMEARRYRFYELVRERVRLLERSLMTDALGGEPEPCSETLLRSLSNPKPPVQVAAALAVRLRRNYLWIYGAVFVVWLLKLAMHGTGGLRDAATLGPVPGLAIVGGVSAGLLLLIVVAIRAPRIESE